MIGRKEEAIGLYRSTLQDLKEKVPESEALDEIIQALNTSPENAEEVRVSSIIWISYETALTRPVDRAGCA